MSANPLAGSRTKSSICAVLAFASALLVSPSIRAAESMAEAMRAFGLTGTWSPDCAKDPVREGYRWTYTIPIFGEPILTTIASQTGTSNKITLAIRITEEKIKYIREPYRLVYRGQTESLSDKQREPIETLIYRAGNNIRVVDERAIHSGRIFVRDGYSYEPYATGTTSDGASTLEKAKDYERAMRALTGASPSPAIGPEKLPEARNTGKQTPFLEKCLN